MKCSKCNAENVAGSGFCAECGAPLEVSNAVVYETPYFKSVGTMVVGIICLAVCLFICLALFLNDGTIALPGGALGVGGVCCIVAGARKSKFTVKRDSLDVLWQGKNSHFAFADLPVDNIKCKGKTLKINRMKFKFKGAQEVYDALVQAKQSYDMNR